MKVSSLASPTGVALCSLQYGGTKSYCTLQQGRPLQGLVKSVDRDITEHENPLSHGPAGGERRAASGGNGIVRVYKGRDCGKAAEIYLCTLECKNVIRTKKTAAATAQNNR
jgi:hypothetical protein